MAKRKLTKEKPGITLSVTPVRRKLAMGAVLITIVAVTLESEFLQVLNPGGSIEEGGQQHDDLSDLESILTEFGDDEESPDTPGSKSKVSTQLTTADESFPLLIPSVDEVAEVPARSVSFPRQSPSERPGMPTGHGQSPSTVPGGGGGAYSFHSTRSDHPPAATGIRFTGDIQPIH